MRAVQRDRYGDTSVLRLVDLPEPEPAADEVLVRVAAAGVNMADWHLMTGLPSVARLVLGPRAPRRRGLGNDLAGTVVAVGTEVRGPRVEDRVIGYADGAFAEIAVTHASRLAPLPDAVPFEAAAAVPTAGTTALHALRLARVERGSRVLVLGAGGGVGSLTVRLAVLAGADVVAATSAAKRDVPLGLGASQVVDRDDPAGFGDGYDAVIVTGGLTGVRTLRDLLAPRGSLALVGAEGGGTFLGGGLARQARTALLDPWTRRRLRTVVSRENPDDLMHLRDLLADGSLVPVIERSYPLDEFAAAIDHVASGHVRGKLVLAVSSPAAGLPAGG